MTVLSTVSCFFLLPFTHSVVLKGFVGIHYQREINFAHLQWLRCYRKLQVLGTVREWAAVPAFPDNDNVTNVPVPCSMEALREH